MATALGRDRSQARRDCSVSRHGNRAFGGGPSSEDKTQHVAITEAVEDVTLALGGSFFRRARVLVQAGQLWHDGKDLAYR